MTSRHTTLIIGGSAAAGSFLAGTPTCLGEDAVLTAEGWDSLTAIYAHRRPSLSAEEAIALHPIGSCLGTRNWWVCGVKPACIAPGVWTAEVTCKGWAGTRPNKVNWGCAAEQQSAANISAPVPAPGTGSTTYAKLATHEATPTFTTSYLCADVTATGAVPSASVGREVAAPAGAPVVPESVWLSLSEYVYHFPNGWVLMDAQADILPGTNVGLVTLAYKYIRYMTP